MSNHDDRFDYLNKKDGKDSSLNPVTVFMIKWGLVFLAIIAGLAAFVGVVITVGAWAYKLAPVIVVLIILGLLIYWGSKQTE